MNIRGKDNFNCKQRLIFIQIKNTKKNKQLNYIFIKKHKPFYSPSLLNTNNIKYA